MNLKSVIPDDRKPKKKGIVSLLRIVMLLVFILLICLFFSVPVRRHFEEKQTSLYRMSVLYDVLCNYAKAHDGKLPSAETWCDELMQFDKGISKEMFRDGHSDDPRPCHIAFNSNLGNTELQSLSAKTVILFAANGDWNLNGSGELINDQVTTPILSVNGAMISCRKKNGGYWGRGSDSNKQYELEW